MSSADETSPAASLSVAEDLPFQRRLWAAERVGWIVMGLLVLAALAGVFSAGPLSRAAAQDPAGRLRLEYDRYVRYKATTTWRVTFLKPPGPGDTATLRLSRSLIETVEIDGMQPQPLQSLAAPEALILTFRLDRPEQPATVHFSITPQHPGPLAGEIGLAGQRPAQVASFVYP